MNTLDAETKTDCGQSLLADGLAAAIPWRCFHCGETFVDAADAAMHFGQRIYSDPACHVDAERLRELERQLDGYREEDTDLHRQIAALECRHQQDVMRAEEAGYARGLRDAMADGLVTANDRVEGRDAASSRRVPSHDGLCGNGNYEERTDK